MPVANILRTSSVPDAVLTLKHIVQCDVLCSPLRLVPSSVLHLQLLFTHEETQLYTDS